MKKLKTIIAASAFLLLTSVPLTVAGCSLYKETGDSQDDTCKITVITNHDDYGRVNLGDETSTKIEFDVDYGSSITLGDKSFTVDGQTVRAIANPDILPFKYLFTGWTNAQGKVTENRTITANFDRQYQSFDVTVGVDGSSIGFGTVNVTKVEKVPYNSEISVNGDKITINKTEITATPKETAQDSNGMYVFVGWMGVEGNIISARSIYAKFAFVNKYNSAVVISSNDSYGTVSSNAIDNAIDHVVYGTDIIINENNSLQIGEYIITPTATAGNSQYDYIFKGWSISEDGGVNFVKIGTDSKFNASSTIRADFERVVKEYDVTLNISNESKDGYINFGGFEYVDSYGKREVVDKIKLPYGSTIAKSENEEEKNVLIVTLPKDESIIKGNQTPKIIAVPTDSTEQYKYTFKEWTTDLTTPLEVNGNKTVEAAFERSTQKYSIKLSVNNEKYGVIDGSSEPGPVDYNTSVSVSGSKITVNGTDYYCKSLQDSDAEPYRYAVVGWALNGEIIKGAKQIKGESNVVAIFEKQYKVLASITDDSKDGADIFGSVPEYVFVPAEGTLNINGNKIQVGNKTLTATPKASSQQYSYEFVEWNLLSRPIVKFTTKTNSEKADAIEELDGNRILVRFTSDLGVDYYAVVAKSDIENIALNEGTNFVSTIKFNSTSSATIKVTGIDEGKADLSYKDANSKVYTSRTAIDKLNVKLGGNVEFAYGVKLGSDTEEAIYVLSKEDDSVTIAFEKDGLLFTAIADGDDLVLEAGKTIADLNENDSVKIKNVMTFKHMKELTPNGEEQIEIEKMTSATKVQLRYQESEGVDYTAIVDLESISAILKEETAFTASTLIDDELVTISKIEDSEEGLKITAVYEDENGVQYFAEILKANVKELNFKESIELVAEKEVSTEDELTVKSVNGNEITVVIVDNTVEYSKVVTADEIVFAVEQDKAFEVNDKVKLAKVEVALGDTIVNPMEVTAKFRRVTNAYAVSVSFDEGSSEFGTLSGNTSFDTEYNTEIVVNENKLTIGENEITATPKQSTAEYTYRFVGWKIGGEDITGANNKILDETSIVAVFEKVYNTYTIRIVANNAEYGSVSQNLIEGVSYDTEIMTGATLTVGETVVTATANPGYEFVGWSYGAVVNGEMTITARFREVNA